MLLCHSQRLSGFDSIDYKKKEEKRKNAYKESQLKRKTSRKSGREEKEAYKLVQ